MKASATQQRYLKFLMRRFPDDTKRLIDVNGGVLEQLTSTEADEILREMRRLHPRDDDNQGNDDNMIGRNKRRDGFRPGSKQEVISRALKECNFDEDLTYTVLEPSVGSGPLRFGRNVGNSREALPLDEQKLRLRREIRSVHRALESLGLTPNNGRGRGKKLSAEEERRWKLERDAQELIRWIRNLRSFCRSRAADGKPLDEIGLRPAEYGARMLVAGIPVDAIKFALTMHYPTEVRRTLGIVPFNVQNFNTTEREEGVHAALPYCMALVSQRIPLALIGPKGTGKTTLARQIAMQLGLPFGMVSMTNGTSPSAFNGRPKIGSDGTEALTAALIARGNLDEAYALTKRKHDEGDVAPSQFETIFGGGGLFLFDEMDAGNENLLLIMNSAIANGVFYNTATGRITEQHPDFIAAAGMNTLGLGAGRDYSSRNRLDAATLDRWLAGRVRIELDERIEDWLFWDIIQA